MQNQKRNMPSLEGSYCNTTNTTCAARAVRGHLMQQFRFFFRNPLRLSVLFLLASALLFKFLSSFCDCCFNVCTLYEVQEY